MSLDKLKLLKKTKPFARVEGASTRGLLSWQEHLIELSSSEADVCTLMLRSAADLKERARAQVSFSDTVTGGVAGDRLHIVTGKPHQHQVFKLESLALLHEQPLPGVDGVLQIEDGRLLGRVGDTVVLFQLGDKGPAQLARASLQWKNGGSGYVTGALRGDKVVVRGPGDHTGWKILQLRKDALVEIGSSPGSMNQAENLAWLSDTRFAAYGIGKKVRLFELQGETCAGLGGVDVGARYTACVSDAGHLFVYDDYDRRFDKGVLVDVSGEKPQKEAAVPYPPGMSNLLVKDGRAYFSADDLVGVQL